MTKLPLMPLLNRRVKEIIERYDDGNVKSFAARLQTISQQRLNRIFNLDSRTLKYPSVPDDVLVAIANVLPDVDMGWLLTGKGTMLKDGVVGQNAGINMGSMQQSYGHDAQNTIGISAEELDAIMARKMDTMIDILKQIATDVEELATK